MKVGKDSKLTVAEKLDRLNRKELEMVVRGVVDALYLADDEEHYTREKSWSADTLDTIVWVLDVMNLVPQEGEKP